VLYINLLTNVHLMVFTGRNKSRRSRLGRVPAG
jgi:hypothetical protein